MRFQLGLFLMLVVMDMRLRLMLFKLLMALMAFTRQTRLSLNKLETLLPKLS